jgi:hypothetical protein
MTRRIVSSDHFSPTLDHWDELQSTQTAVDGSTTYVPSDSWDPLSSAGDCKTFAPRTTLALLECGRPAGAVRMATAFVNDGSAQNGASHAVVLIDTDHGTIVLDSRLAVGIAVLYLAIRRSPGRLRQLVAAHHGYGGSPDRTPCQPCGTHAAASGISTMKAIRADFLCNRRLA